MKLGFDLNLEQKQELVMTPELQKAIKLLQLSGLELSSYIEEELVENPMLEVEAREDEELSDSHYHENEKTDQTEASTESFDIDWQNYFADSSDLGRQFSAKQDPEDSEQYKSVIENSSSYNYSLLEHMYFQLSMVDASPKIKEFAEFLVGDLTASGYLQNSLEEVSKYTGANVCELEQALALIQSLDPSGVGARSLQECLRLQLERTTQCPEIAYLLVDSYLNEIGENRLDKIAKKVDEPVEKIQEAVDYIKSLTPKPAAPFSEGEAVSYITPDLVIRRVDNEYEVLVNDTWTPRLKINSKYKNLLGKDNHSGAKKFLNSRLDKALWLIKSIEQRRLTLYNIACQLVEHQRAFLDYGVSHLKPLTLKEIANEVGVHESTVSRATANKYAQTPHGVYPLRFFFSSKLKSTSNDYSSSTSIKQQIKDLIENEDKTKPLSDQKIAEMIKNFSTKISRRTVAKYRKELSLPSSSKRKRYH